MVDNPDHKPGTPSHIHIGPSDEKKTNWLPWILGALALLALLLLLPYACSRNDERDPVATAPAAAPVADPGTAGAAGAGGVVAATPLVLPNGRTVQVERGTIGEQVGTYFAGSEAAPRTFQFDRLHFDTGKSDVRAEDQGTLQGLSEILAAYPNSRVRVIGYADSRGSDPANAQLGAARANAVKAALVSGGVDAGRIDTASGGESNPAETNATAGGQAENRRTEFVVVSR
ncbi:MAG TPA: OmpA family protein [Allosphingosinicella sp.]|jgi:outer membrane protein OmpA-like peptidoglycan-associated protein